MKLKPTEQKGEIGKSTTIVGDFNTFFLSTIDRTNKPKNQQGCRYFWGNVLTINLLIQFSH